MDVEYWEDGRGLCPVEEFILVQPSRAQSKIIEVVGHLEEFGLSLQAQGPLFQKLRGYDLYELRIKVSRVLYRVFVVIDGSTAWLVHIFKKQSAQTPKRHIETALARQSLIKGTNRS